MCRIGRSPHNSNQIKYPTSNKIGQIQIQPSLYRSKAHRFSINLNHEAYICSPSARCSRFACIGQDRHQQQTSRSTRRKPAQPKAAQPEPAHPSPGGPVARHPHRLTQTHGDDDIDLTNTAAIRDPHQVNIFAYDELAVLLSQIEAEDTGRDVFSAQSVPNLAKFARSIVEVLDANPKFTLDVDDLQELVVEEMGLDDTDEEVLESFATALKRLERTGVIRYNDEGKLRVALMEKEDATRKSDPYGERGNGGGDGNKDKDNNNDNDEEDDMGDEKKKGDDDDDDGENDENQTSGGGMVAMEEGTEEMAMATMATMETTATMATTATTATMPPPTVGMEMARRALVETTTPTVPTARTVAVTMAQAPTAVTPPMAPAAIPMAATQRRRVETRGWQSQRLRQHRGRHRRWRLWQRSLWQLRRRRFRFDKRRRR